MSAGNILRGIGSAFSFIPGVGQAAGAVLGAVGSGVDAGMSGRQRKRAEKERQDQQIISRTMSGATRFGGESAPGSGATEGLGLAPTPMPDMGNGLGTVGTLLLGGLRPPMFEMSQPQGQPEAQPEQDEPPQQPLIPSAPELTLQPPQSLGSGQPKQAPSFTLSTLMSNRGFYG